MDLKELIVPLRKWWWLLLASTLIASASSFFAVQQQPPIYRTFSTLIVGQAISNPNPNGGEFYLLQQLAQTYTELGNRNVVRNAAMERLGIDWLPEYTIRTLPNSQLIEITVTDTSPERAQVIANELANQIILQSPTSQERSDQERQQFIQSQLDQLQVQILDTQDEITAKESELASFISARQIADNQEQINALRTKLSTLQSNYAALLSNSNQGAINTVSLFEPALLPETPVGAGIAATIITAAAIGFTLAAGAAYLLEYLDDTIKTPEDISKITGLPTLAGIARIDGGDQERHLITFSQPRSPIAEAFRVLRTGVRFANVDSDKNTLLVTSANPTEGKSVTVANLAVVMAQAGHRVLLLDADLRRPVQHKIFDIGTGQGLTNLLLDLDAKTDQSYMDTIVDSSIMPLDKIAGLFILPSGPIPPNPSELLGSVKMQTLLSILSAKFDFVIIDSPPSLAVTDAVALSTQVGSVLLVVDAGRTRRNQFQQAVERLREVRAKIIGVTLNRLTSRNGGYYYYYYYRQSYYRSDADAKAEESVIANNGNLNGQGSKKKTRKITTLFSAKKQKSST